MTTISSERPAPLPMAQLMLCGALIVTLSMGVRHGFGLWLLPITQTHGWSRETFSVAIAVQNLAWGLLGIVAGMAADRFGAMRVIMAGGLLYLLGLSGMALATQGWQFTLAAGILVGAAQSATTYAVIYGVIGRNVVPEKRAWAMGVVGAAGSFGQFAMVPLEGWMISHWGWQMALLVLAACCLLMLPLSRGLNERVTPAAGQGEQTMRQALKEALRYPSFQLLTAGYFVCGFQVVFIGIHMPSYLRDAGLEPGVAGTALALIGLFNIFGTYMAGSLAQKGSKKMILAGIYLARAVAITVFLLVPLSPWSVYVFAAVMGLLWLSTVPVTNATVAHIFGVKYLSMLGGSVFFSHQLGSFAGVWLGGYLYDRTGSYDVVWYIAIGLGVFAALVNLPVREAPIVRHPVPAQA
jgi:MFS family permease